MTRIPALASVGYDPEMRILEIEFRSGRVYEYYNIEEDMYKALLSSSSHGSYFCSHIRNGGYWERVE
jgi:hypothetical protein